VANEWAVGLQVMQLFITIGGGAVVDLFGRVPIRRGPPGADKHPRRFPQ
jgi:hypothetical protein